MRRIVLLVSVLAGMALCLASTGWAAVPAPPVNQTIGKPDVLITSLTEAECRGCHDNSGANNVPTVPNRHHLLYGTPLAPAPVTSRGVTPPDVVPYPDVDGVPGRDANYSCMSCHGSTFAVVRDCLACHKTSPHHEENNILPTAGATLPVCKKCHGSVVDDPADGHYIPTYAPSLVTPKFADGEGLPLNSRGNGAGACNYCHDADNIDATLAVIKNPHDLHHGALSSTVRTNRCNWCHIANDSTGIHNGPAGAFRTATAPACENCHAPGSLHKIQAISPKNAGKTTITVGGEDAGYGHVGRDAGPGDSDCWGCHGFATAAIAPDSGPVIPTLNNADKATITAGTDTVIVLSGAAFTNTAGDAVYEVDVILTAADGSSVTLTPDLIVDEGSLAVTIPGSTAPGNYSLRALKADVTSNPAVVTIVPQVKVKSAAWSQSTKNVTITGAGFSGFAAGSGTTVTGDVTNGLRTKSVTGQIVSWSDGKIVVKFDLIPVGVTVKSVFGNAKTSSIGKQR